MRLLNDDTLLETYFRAIDLQLEREFIHLLREEIHRRKINISIIQGDRTISRP
ncbi:sporulation histidine kinase inhibitor Sda [Paenibacillus thermoaerophilus]|uniref:Sporulation histidine kinase inhibitor Sda n=1 Tax=Paenibacillus thermoaerophilus TaxID=1215385 RepID=A0ABW2V120_9BACL|nr:sporulation histidine kinase inhibitor Sda [Paenibacillus thermoaerophilus]TMV18390.1 sporulation histidine kinase inhibitor Sda [Paenibacillus thermoaerophilus]